MQLIRHAGDNIFFSHKKRFTMKATLNKLSDRVYAACLCDIPADKRAVERFPKCITRVGLGIAKKGNCPCYSLTEA